VGNLPTESYCKSEGRRVEERKVRRRKSTSNPRRFSRELLHPLILV
jgi:hypothetical protein